MSTTLAIWLLTTSCLGCGHRTAVDLTPTVAVCEVSNRETNALRQTIEVLEHGARPRSRDKAARLLRKFDERSHPEIVAAWVNALRNDCAGKVREEAAESLSKLSFCEAVVHESLVFAADHDPDRGTRHAAKRGLKRLSRRCVGDCDVCGPASSIVPSEQAVTTIVPAESTLEPLPSSSEKLPVPLPDDSMPVELIPVPDSRLESPVSPPSAEPDLEGPAMGNNNNARVISSRRGPTN